MADNQNQDYMGKRALMLLRVSTPEQEKGFGWPAQESEIRKKLLEPLGLRLDEDRHIIRDTYTGLEFRERPALDRILEMAQRHEFDLLVTDVLDRLGRKGLAREIYRMQLRELGIRVLTTDPNEHSDDDSLIGEMVRLIKGYQAEEELNNIRRRTMNGKKAKATGIKDGTKRMVGNHTRTYGYKFTYSENGKKEGYEINCDVILVEEDGKEWTEHKVVIFIFESAAAGVTTREIARILTDKGMPTPTIAKGNKIRRRTGPPVWQPSVVQKVLKNSTYWGEFHQFRVRMLDKVPGLKYKPYQHNPAEEHVIISVPAIVTKELAEKAHRIMQRNQRVASRNNPNPKENLLRAGLIKCADCGGSMTACRYLGNKNGIPYVRYSCSKSKGLIDRCGSKTTIPARVVDEAAWQRTLEIIRDPSEVDEKLAALKSDDPTADRRKHISNQLAKVRKTQAAFREQLAKLMMEEEIDRGTIEFLKGQLKQLADQEEGWKREIADEEDIHSRWKKVQEKLSELHRVCTDMREKLNDINYEPAYDKKRELIEYFGITAKVWKHGHAPRFEIECNPPDIVSLISLALC